MKFSIIATALALAGCSFNPTEGDFGVMEVVPEQDSCETWVENHNPDTGEVTWVAVMVPCDGEDHDVKFLGRRW